MSEYLMNLLNSPLFPFSPSLGQWALAMERTFTTLLAVLALWRMLEATYSLNNKNELSINKMRYYISCFIDFWKTQPHIKLGLMMIGIIMFIQVFGSFGFGVNPNKSSVVCSVTELSSKVDVLSVYLAIFQTSLQLIFYGIGKSASRIEGKIVNQSLIVSRDTLQL